MELRIRLLYVWMPIMGDLFSRFKAFKWVSTRTVVGTRAHGQPIKLTVEYQAEVRIRLWKPPMIEDVRYSPD